MTTDPTGRGSGAAAAASTWSLRRRLGALMIVVGVLLVAVVGTAAGVLIRVRHQQRVLVNDYYRAAIDSDALFTDLVDAETAVRGYALTGAAVALQPLAGLQSDAARAQSDRLQRFVDRDPRLHAAFTRSSATSSAWVQQWLQPTIAEVQTRGARSVTTAQVLEGKRIFDQVRSDYNAYLDVLNARRAAARQELVNSTNLLFGTVLAAVLGLVVVLVLLWLALSSWVTKPVLSLAAETRLVRAGTLDHEVQAWGPPEIAGLGQDVEQMRQQVVGQLAEVKAARDGLQTAQAQLEAQAAELERSNRDLEQFAYVASHDLQEPLRKVASFCQLLERRYAGQLDERADQYIAFAVDGAKRMQQLINDLLAFSRIGRRTTGRREVSLQECLTLALRNLQTVLEETGAEVEADPLPVVHGEPALLTALLQNLISNAVKFRGDRRPQVRLVARQEGPMWEFFCADNGIGIEPQYADRIFVIFQRLHAKDEYAGTGIGLAMCKKIVEWHGGAISLVTADDDVPAAARCGGTTFRWTLPQIELGRALMESDPIESARPLATAAAAPGGNSE